VGPCPALISQRLAGLRRESQKTLRSLGFNDGDCRVLMSQIALVSQTARVGSRELLEVASALQIQVARDWSPVWREIALVAGFETLEDVPPGSWPMIVVDSGQGEAGGRLDQDGQPYALVEAGDSWSLSASQACLEMLADPSGSRLISAESAVLGPGQVEFLVEICKPTADPRYAYLIDGVTVSDFCTPAYFQARQSVGPYCFSGAVERPRQVLPGGCLTWRDSVSHHWHQLTYLGQQPEIRDLGLRPPMLGSARSWVAGRTPGPQRSSHLATEVAVVSAARRAREARRKAAHQRAISLREEIERRQRAPQDET
jgi:hypothetical protein